MHGGDGNVHTNIPVNSDDYVMLKEANAAVARVMALARELNGVISGEHGIGITKLEFLKDEELAPFADYKRRVDPEGRFNRGKLQRSSVLPADLTNAYTPSFSLIGHESLILEQSAIGEILDSIKDCLRCGKCKAPCATHSPRANLLYSPRNKILAVSLLTEAFLYEEQTRRGVSLRHFDEFSDVADHCTVCHKCKNPCPVDIAFGAVSIALRNLQRKQSKHAHSSDPRLATAFPTTHNPAPTHRPPRPLCLAPRCPTPTFAAGDGSSRSIPRRPTSHSTKGSARSGQGVLATLAMPKLRMARPRYIGLRVNL